MLFIILLIVIFILAYNAAPHERKEDEHVHGARQIGLLYMYSLGPFNEGGGSYAASMRYLWPTLSLIVAVALIQDRPCPLSGEASFLTVSWTI